MTTKLLQSEAPPEKCEHTWKFLRQTAEREHGARYGDMLTQDVFFCDKCLEYRSVTVKRTPFGARDY